MLYCQAEHLYEGNAPLTAAFLGQLFSAHSGLLLPTKQVTPEPSHPIQWPGIPTFFSVGRLPGQWGVTFVAFVCIAMCVDSRQVDAARGSVVALESLWGSVKSDAQDMVGSASVLGCYVIHCGGENGHVFGEVVCIEKHIPSSCMCICNPPKYISFLNTHLLSIFAAAADEGARWGAWSSVGRYGGHGVR